jgi:hypothetical protein
MRTAARFNTFYFVPTEFGGTASFAACVDTRRIEKRQMRVSQQGAGMESPEQGLVKFTHMTKLWRS